MPNGDEFHQLSDREILVLIADRIKVLPDHEKRLRWLERLAYGLIGAWFLLSAWLKVHIMGGK